MTAPVVIAKADSPFDDGYRQGYEDARRDTAALFRQRVMAARRRQAQVKQQAAQQALHNEVVGLRQEVRALTAPDAPLTVRAPYRPQRDNDNGDATLLLIFGLIAVVVILKAK